MTPPLTVLGLVPARGGSQRIEDKNLAEVGGVTLVRRALETISTADRVAAVALSSDDSRILGQADGLDEVIPVRRPPELSTAESSSHSAVIHALEETRRLTGLRFDAVALVQCTSPFTLPGDIDGAIALMERTGAGSVFTVCELDHAYHPEKVRALEGDRLVGYQDDVAPRAAHDVQALWINNGSVYVSRLETLERGSLASKDLSGFPMPRERSLDINSPLDLDFARFLDRRRHREDS